MSWRVGSKTGVTLFKGEELYGMLQSPEKAATVVRWLRFGEELGEYEGPWLDFLTDEQLQVLATKCVMEKRRRDGVEAGGGQAEGGAGGDLATARAASVRGGICAMGERCGGDCAPGWNCGDPGE